VVSVYGNGEPGMRDGEGRDAQFNSPQGLAWRSGVLYVADTENHAIRKVRVGKATNSYTQAPAHPLHPFGTLSIEPLYPYFLIMECQLGIAVTWSVVSVLPPVPLVWEHCHNSCGLSDHVLGLFLGKPVARKAV